MTLRLTTTWRPLDIPVTPGPDEARQWAVDELSKGVYHEGESLWDQFLRWLDERINEITAAGSAQGPVVTLAILAALLGVIVVIVIAVRRSGRMNRALHNRTSAQVLTDDARSSEQMRVAAQEAADAGDFSLAVVERFRGIARSLEERTILDEHPGRTAREVSVSATARLAPFGEELRWAADLFDVVCYSEQIAATQDYHRIRELDIAIGHARPSAADPAEQPIPGLVVPS